MSLDWFGGSGGFARRSGHIETSLRCNDQVRLGLDRYKLRLLKSKNCPMESRLSKVEEGGST